MMATPLHSRSEVGLRPPRSVSRNVTSEGDSAHYGGPSPWGSSADRSSPERFAATTDHARCASIWRAWQAFHMDARGWVDIAYSSGVCPHGHRYDGRGPGVRTAAQGTTDGNNRSLATVYIAGDDDPSTDGAKRAFLDEGRRLATLRWGHRDWKSTACPGEPLYAWRRAGWPAPAGTTTPTPQEDDVGTVDEFSEGAQAQMDLVVQEALRRALGRPHGKYGHAAKQVRARVIEGVHLALSTPGSDARKGLGDLMRKVAAEHDVDEAEVAELILDGLDAEAIAAAIPDGLAGEVADELARRLSA